MESSCSLARTSRSFTIECIGVKGINCTSRVLVRWMGLACRLSDALLLLPCCKEPGLAAALVVVGVCCSASAEQTRVRCNPSPLKPSCAASTTLGTVTDVYNSFCNALLEHALGKGVPKWARTKWSQEQTSACPTLPGCLLCPATVSAALLGPAAKTIDRKRMMQQLAKFPDSKNTKQGKTEIIENHWVKSALEKEDVLMPQKQ